MSLLYFCACRNIFCTAFVWMYPTTKFLTDEKSSNRTLKNYVRYNIMWCGRNNEKTQGKIEENEIKMCNDPCDLSPAHINVVSGVIWIMECWRKIHWYSQISTSIKGTTLHVAKLEVLLKDFSSLREPVEKVLGNSKHFCGLERC